MQAVCRYCGKVLEDPLAYFIHFTRECKGMPRTRRCPVCGARFHSIRLLKIHLMNEALVEPKHRALILARLS